MKLLLKTSLYYLLFTIPVLLIAGFVFFNVITHEVKESNNELLYKRTLIIENYLKLKDTVAINLISKSFEAQVVKLPKNYKIKTKNNIFSDTLIYDRKENELAENSIISAFVEVNNDKFQIKTWRSTLEYDELIKGIFYLFSLLLFALFLITLLINLWISKTIWKPFYQTLEIIKNFRASNNQVNLPKKNTITEFTNLNNSLSNMMEKMILDYNNQKKFTENASHEIQTPIAVIKSKIDLLVQSKNIDEQDLKIITAIDDSCSKLIRLNKSLLLLTKIGNNQFLEKNEVSFQLIIANSLTLFEEQILNNDLQLKQTIEEDFLFKMNPDLCLILINNLIQNAVRHNIQNGFIEIEITKTSIKISNSGIHSQLETNVFERFQKNSTSNNSVGLGLAISKEITVISNLNLNYDFLSNKHTFIISI